MSKRKLLAWVLMITMIFTNMSWPSGIFTFTTAEAASTTVTEAEELTPEATCNKGDQNYSAASSPVCSYLVSVDSLDATMVLRYDSLLISLDETQLLAGDVNFDGVVDSTDAVQILRYDAQLINSFE